MHDNLVNFVNQCWNKESIFAVLGCGKKRRFYMLMKIRLKFRTPGVTPSFNPVGPDHPLNVA